MRVRVCVCVSRAGEISCSGNSGSILLRPGAPDGRPRLVMIVFSSCCFHTFSEILEVSLLFGQFARSTRGRAVDGSTPEFPFGLLLLHVLLCLQPIFLGILAEFPRNRPGDENL